MRKERELDDARRELDLAVEKKVHEGLAAVRDKAKAEAEEGLKARVAEKEVQIAGMQRQIEELRRKAEQGSQQIQGEALELELEALLRSRFPRDVIEPVPKGEFGGDVLHRVLGPSGQACGTILWESKRTKNSSDNWLPKLRDDLRSATAEIALIVSSVLPSVLRYSGTGRRRCEAGTFWTTPADRRQGPHIAVTEAERLTVRRGAMRHFAEGHDLRAVLTIQRQWRAM